MGNVGRFFCVALPFILTTASIICMLIAGLSGVTGNSSLYIFRANVTGLTISPASVETLLSSVSSRDVSSSTYHDRSFLDGSSGSTSGSSGTTTDGSSASGTSDEWASATSAAAAAVGSSSSTSSSTSSTTLSSNITAADLALYDLYDVNLWGYCYTDDNGDRTCTKAAFDWAESALNTSSLTSIGSSVGYNITLPSEITSSLKAFKTVTKWTEVVYIIAMIALALELVAGCFTYCSRAISCITYLISGIATVAVCAAAAMVTAMAVIVVGAIEGTAKYYGVDGSVNTSFLATIWLGAAFAIGASMFWLFSACCCKRDPSTRRNKNLDDEKPFLANGSYAPIHDRNSYGYNNQQAYAAPRNNNNARSDLAYEPYSHSRV